MTGFDPVYGARPLRRLVQSAIGDQLARALLSGEIADGDTVIVDLDQESDALTTRSARLPAVPASPGLSLAPAGARPAGVRPAAGRSRPRAARGRCGSGSAG